MKIGIYSPFTSPPITPHTSNKLNKVDLMGREWFETPCLRGRRAKGVVMLRFTFNTKKLTKMGICSTKLTSPGRPHLKCTERGEFGRLWVILDHSPVWRRAVAGEVDVFNLIYYKFSHTKIQITKQILIFHRP
jgi:hypothetical protein